MSLILDALKRSEQERHDNADDVILAEYTVHPHNEFNLMPWLIAAILLLNVTAIAFLFYLKPWQSEAVENPPFQPSTFQPSSTTATTEPKAAPPVAAVAAIAPPHNNITAIPQFKPLAAQQMAPKAIIPARPLSSEQIPAPQVKPKVAKVTAKPADTSTTETKATNSQFAENAVPSSASTAATQAVGGEINDLLRLQDIPEAIRTKLETFEVNAHVFSEEPAKRFVLLNLKKRREGDKINDFRLERILPNGFVIDYGEGRTLVPLGAL